LARTVLQRAGAADWQVSLDGVWCYLRPPGPATLPRQGWKLHVSATRWAELDRVTAGLAGQTILSDRPYRKGSLVHYRYGAFGGRIELSNDGEYVPC